MQALERTAPILALRPGVPARQTHDYVRNGTTTLFAALNTLNGKVIEQCFSRHRHTEFLQFLERIDKKVSAKLDIHLIHGQLRDAQTPRGKSLVCEPPTVPRSLYADQFVLAECSRTILLRNHGEAHMPRHVRFGARTRARNRLFRRGA